MILAHVLIFLSGVQRFTVAMFNSDFYFYLMSLCKHLCSRSFFHNCFKKDSEVSNYNRIIKKLMNGNSMTWLLFVPIELKQKIRFIIFKNYLHDWIIWRNPTNSIKKILIFCSLIFQKPLKVTTILNMQQKRSWRDTCQGICLFRIISFFFS